MKKFDSLILFSILCTLCAGIVSAQPAMQVTAQELLEDAPQYDGQVVIYQGEVVGDIMHQGEFVWVNLRDKTAAIGVFCPQGLAQAITFKGNFKFTGDQVIVRGIFHYVCPEHGGDSDIHAQEFKVVKKGEPINQIIEPARIKAGMILLLSALLLGVTYLILKRLIR